MPIEEKVSAVSVDVYALNFEKKEISLNPVANLQNINASFRYVGDTFQMIVLSEIELENGIAIVDYSETLDKIVVFYAYQNDERLFEPVEFGEFLDKKTLSELSSKIGSILMNKSNPVAYVIDGYENSEEDEPYKLTKLLPTTFEIHMFD
ncbi:MAG: hypothetical protein ACHQX1_03065 [Candidatus Micrarchaeales archaeon]